MFYLVGAGLQAKHLSIEAIEAVQKCDKVFLDSYTSYFPKTRLREMEKTFGKSIVVLQRQDIEESFGEKLELAKNKNVCLLASGNPLTATTHVQLLIDAKRLGVQTRLVPGISITSFLGSTGLDAYRFGRTTTIVAPKKNFSPESFFDVIEKNQEANYHSLCLLDCETEKNFFLDIPSAIKILERTEKKRNAKIIKESVLVGLYAIASKKQKIVSGRASKLKKLKLPLFPQSLVVCAELNSKEKEAIKVLLND